MKNLSFLILTTFPNSVTKGWHLKSFSISDYILRWLFLSFSTGVTIYVSCKRSFHFSVFKMPSPLMPIPSFFINYRFYRCVRMGGDKHVIMLTPLNRN